MKFNPRVEEAISTPRLNAYRGQASSDDHAWALYRWNIDLVAAIVSLVADLEVTLRNTIHDRLTQLFGRPDWWASTSLHLDDNTARMLTKVVLKHQSKIARGTAGPGQVVADTTLGVWVNLLGRGGQSALKGAIDYETRLWRPALRFGFSTGTFTPTGRERRPTRAEVYRRASLLQRLRNRAAHHEPILNGIQILGSQTVVALDDVWEQSVELLGWMSPTMAGHHRNHSALPALLANRPQP